MGHKHSKPAGHRAADPNESEKPDYSQRKQEKGFEKCYMIEKNPDVRHRQGLGWIDKWKCVPYPKPAFVSVFGNEDAGASTDPGRIRHKDVNMKRKRELSVEGEGEGVGGMKRWTAVEGEGGETHYILDPEGEVEAFEYNEYDFEGEGEGYSGYDGEEVADPEDDSDDDIPQVPSFDPRLLGRDVLLGYNDGVPYFGSLERPDIPGLRAQYDPVKIEPLGSAASKMPTVMAALATPTMLASAAQATLGGGNASHAIDNKGCTFEQGSIGSFHQAWECLFKPMYLLVTVLLFIALIMTCMWSVSRSARRARSQDVEGGYLRRAGAWVVPGWVLVGKENRVVI